MKLNMTQAGIFNTITDEYLFIARMLADRMKVKINWAERGERPEMDFKTQTITAPYPRSAADFGVVLHELGHARDQKRADREGWPDWKFEARASQWAKRVYDVYDLPHPGDVNDRLAQGLSGYLRDAFSRGAVTADEARREIGDTALLAYSERMGVFDTYSEDEIRGFLMGPPV